MWLEFAAPSAFSDQCLFILQGCGSSVSQWAVCWWCDEVLHKCLHQQDKAETGSEELTEWRGWWVKRDGNSQASRDSHQNGTVKEKWVAFPSFLCILDWDYYMLLSLTLSPTPPQCMECMRLVCVCVCVCVKFSLRYVKAKVSSKAGYVCKLIWQWYGWWYNLDSKEDNQQWSGFQFHWKEHPVSQHIACSSCIVSFWSWLQLVDQPVHKPQEGFPGLWDRHLSICP